MHVSDEGAQYAVTWVRRIFAIAAFGYAASQIGLLFGLPIPADDAFLKAVFLIVHLCLIVIVLQCRASVAARIRSPRPDPGVGGRVRNRIASIWHLLAIFYIAALWLVWAAEVRNGYVRIWHVFLLTIGIMVVARLLSIVVLGGLDRVLRSPPDAHGGVRRADRYYPLVRRVVSALLVLLTGAVLLQAWGFDTLGWFHRSTLGGKLAFGLPDNPGRRLPGTGRLGDGECRARPPPGASGGAGAARQIRQAAHAFAHFAQRCCWWCSSRYSG